MEHINDLKEVLQDMQEEFYESGEIQVFIGAIGRLYPATGRTVMLHCSGIVTEWSEGIYYNADSDIFLFSGELRTSFGGERTEFIIEGEMLGLLSEPLKAALKRVAETEITETVPFGEIFAISPSR